MTAKTTACASVASLCLGVAGFGSGCSGPAPRAEPSAAVTPAPTATPALVAAAKPVFPPQARRKTPPGGIETAALAVGALVPELRLPDDRDGLLRIGGAAPRPTLLLFYRGHW